MAEKLVGLMVLKMVGMMVERLVGLKVVMKVVKVDVMMGA